MTYATLDALIVRYGEDVIVQLADRTVPASGVIDQAAVDRALASAAATIDSSLAVRYRLPLAAVPPVVEDAATAIAFYKLHRFAPEQKAKDEYDQALRDLADLATGRKRLDLAGIEPPTSGGGGVVASDRPRDLTPDNLVGFI